MQKEKLKMTIGLSESVNFQFVGEDVGSENRDLRKVFTMKKADIKAVVENRFRELGAKQLELYPSGICWTMNGEFFKVSTLTDFWVLEWTDNHSYASNYCFEDIAPMPYDISEQEIIWQVDKLLL